MTKQDFIGELRKKLSGLPFGDIDDRINFYGEMIDDMIEEGCGEEDAVYAIGTVDEIAEQIIAETPFLKIAKERIKPKKRLSAATVVLLVLGSPIWLSLCIAAAAVILSLYAVLWVLIVSLWAVFAAIAACALGGVAAGVMFFVRGTLLSAGAIIGAALICAGLSIFLFFGCLSSTKGMALLTKKIALGIKKCFIRKETENEQDN